MVKKYKLVKPESKNNKNQTGGSGVGFAYVSNPGLTGLMPSGPYASPITARYVTPTVRAPSIVTSSGITMGVPMASASSMPDMKIIIPPKVDPRDPSIFLASGPSAPSTPGTKKVLTTNSDVRMTYKEPQPTQAIFQLQPNLPYLPTGNPFSFPVGLTSGTPIIINPNESKAQLEFTSPDSDDIISIIGDQDKVKPVYEAIEKNAKIKLAHNEVIEAGKEWDKNKTNNSGNRINIKKADKTTIVDVDDKNEIPFDQIKGLTEAEINGLLIYQDTTTNETSNAKQIKQAALRLFKAKAALKDARTKTKLKTGKDEDDPDPKELIDLTKLFDKSTVEQQLNILKENSAISFDPSGNIAIQQKQKDSVTQMLFGMPFPINPGYGPMVQIIP